MRIGISFCVCQNGRICIRVRALGVVTPIEMYLRNTTTTRIVNATRMRSVWQDLRGRRRKQRLSAEQTLTCRSETRVQDAPHFSA